MGALDKLLQSKGGIVSEGSALNQLLSSKKNGVPSPAPITPVLPTNPKPELSSFFNKYAKAQIAPNNTVQSQSFVEKPSLSSFFNDAAKKSMVTPSKPVVKQPSALESLYSKLFSKTPQAKTGLTETMRPEDVKAAVYNSVQDKIEVSTQKQPITGKTVSANDIATNIYKLPGRVAQMTAKTTVQFPMSTANMITHPTTPQTYEVNIPRVLQPIFGTDKIQTYQSEATPVFDAVIAGERPMIDALAPFIQVPLDASIASGLLESGAKSVLKRVKVNEYETSAAIQKMGLKDLSVEAQQAQYRKLAKELHPDVGGTTKQMAELNKANDIINKAREQGTLINESGKIAQAMRTLSEIGTSDIKTMPEILAKRNGTESYLGVKGLLPEQAGTIPVNPGAKTQPAFGLSTREINAKPIGSDVVKNLNVARKANDSAAVLDILKEANIPENIAKNVYNTIMKARSEVKIAKIVESVGKIQESRVTLPEVKQTPLIEEAKKYKSVDEIFNASGRYPKAGVDFTRQLKQLVTDNEMSVIRGGKTYTATKQQIRDAEKLLTAIRTDDLSLAEDVFSRYLPKKKMVTGNTSFVAHDNVYNELSGKSQRVVEELRKNKAAEAGIGNETKRALDDLPGVEAIDVKELVQIIRGTKGLTADQIMQKFPDINLKKDVPITDVYGNKKVIPKDDALSPYELKGNKVLLQDGETYIVSKNQYANIKGNSVKAEAKEFAPELKQTEETVRTPAKLGDSNIDESELPSNLQKMLDEYYNGAIDRATLDGEFSKDGYSLLDDEEGMIIDRKARSRYDQYQLPGGNNYKEILIKAPKGNDEVTSSLFKSSHWDEPNVIAHLRMNERTYNGKKVAFMEELQSDWAREARKNSVKNKLDTEEINKRLRTIYDELGELDRSGNGNTPRANQLSEEAELLEENLMVAERNKGGVPGHVLLKNWQELSIKRALKEAVDSNADYFAWINGEQTSARYNLATYVDDVQWNKKAFLEGGEGKTIAVRARDMRGSMTLSINNEGNIVGSTRDEMIGKKLDEVLGKGLADKIMEQESGTLSGEGLRFGGEWANNLYDKQVKNIVEDITGGSVEVIDIGLPMEKAKETLRIGDTAFNPLKESDIKVGQEFNKGIRESQYIITDVLGSGKFKAVRRNSFQEIPEFIAGKLKGEELRLAKELEETFDISVKKSSGQQAIKITPEIRAIVKGEVPELKQASGKLFEDIETPSLPRRSLEESEKAFVDELQLDKYEDAAKISNAKEKIPTQSVLKMEETVKTKLRELRNSKKKIARTREEIIANDQNVKDIIMMNEAEKEVRGSDLVKRFDGVKNAMINSPYFKKEGSFDDRWIESPIYKKGDTYRFATSEESKINLINRGYSYHNSIDGMAEEIGMDAEDFMEKAFDEILQGRQIGTEKAIHNYLMESSKEYAKIDSEIETLTIQINKLKQTHANIKEELSKREDLAIAEEENDIAAKARRDKERNLLREERKAEKIRDKSALPKTARTSQKTNAQNAPGDAQDEKMISNAFAKPKIILSGSDNVYIRLSKTESITKIPRDIQNNLFAIRNGEQIKKEGFIKTVHYLEKKNLKLVRNTNTGEIEVSKINMPGKRLEHIGSALPSASEMNARKTSQITPEINKFSETIKDTSEAKKSALPKIEDKGENIKKGILQSLRDNEKVVRMNRSMQDLIKANASVRPIIIAHNKNLAVGRAEAQKSVNDFRNEFREKGFQDLSENITLHESGKPYAGRTLVEKKFTELYRQAQDLDIDFALRENYLPHVYNETGKEMKDAVVKALRSEGVSEEEIVAYLEGAELPPEIAKSLKMSPFFTKERIFDTYAEAEKYGLTRKYDTISQLVGHYTEELEKIKANRKLVSDLLQNQQITINPKYGDIPVLLPGQEGMYFAKPKVAAYINDVFRNEESLNFMQKGIKALANVSKGMQNIVLSGGFPVSSANFFSFGYVVKSMTAGVGNLATLNIKGATTQLKTIQNFMRSNSRPKAVEWFSKKVDDGTLMRMAEQNIDMSHVMGNYKENNGFATWFKKDLNTVKNSQGIGKAKGVLKIVGKGYDKTFSERTFDSFLPMQTITIFEDTYKNALKKGVEEKEALKLAGDTTKMFMGITDNSRGKTWNDFIGGAFFAPRFREGLVNVYWNSLAGISPNNWNKLKYAQNRKLLIGMGITFFGVYDQLNMKLNGNHIWENPAGKEMQLVVPWKNGTMIYVPFMPSQSAFFRNMVEGGFAFVKGDTDTSKQKFSTLASMPLQAINSVVGNKDYFGNQVYDPDTSLTDQYKDIGAYLGLNYNHPYVNGVVSISREVNASKQPIYPTYVKITDLMNQGKREDADKIINALSDEDRRAYEEMKKMKLKPLYQVLTKMFEIPLTFGSVGKIQSSEYFKKIENIKREIKSLPEEKRTDKIQEFIANSPESERRSLLYSLMQDGIDTTGVSSSSDIIKMKPVYDRVQKLDAEGKSDEAQKIVDDLSDEDYKSYKKVIASVNAKITKQFKNKLEYDPYEAVKYLNSLPEHQGDRLLDNMTDEEYNRYSEGIPKYREEQKSGS